MFVGETRRVVGHALLYAPSPQAALGPRYGMKQPKIPCPHLPSGQPDLRQCHGPHIGIERWIGPADGNLSAMPMQTVWSRPFRAHAGNHRRLAPEDQILTSGGVLFRGHHIWLNAADANGKGGGTLVVGLPEYRLAGYYSLANAEFSTLPFAVPSSKPLWINAEASWVLPPGTPLDKHNLPVDSR
eukprot:SAG22_NODE_342_length_11973_cov_10.127927_6_plen_185_part_00